MEDQKMEQNNNWTAYAHITPSDKIYIGITSQKPEHRWNGGRGYKNQNGPFRNAIKKYGWDNIIHIILRTGMNEKFAKEYEKLMIKFFKQDKKYCMNITDGGDGMTGITPWNKGKTGVMKGYWKGKKFSESHIANLHRHHNVKDFSRMIAVNVFDYNGNFIKSFRSATKASEYTNTEIANVLSCLSGKRNHCGGFQFRKVGDNRPLLKLDKITFEPTYSIVCYNKNTGETKEFESRYDFPRFLNRSIKMTFDTIKRNGSYLGWVILNENIASNGTAE